MSRKILRKRAVETRTGLSHTTIWRREKAGTFPKRIQITESGLVGWYEDEVDAWVHERIRGFGKRPPGSQKGGLMTRRRPDGVPFKKEDAGGTRHLLSYQGRSEDRRYSRSVAPTYGTRPRRERRVSRPGEF